MPPTRTLRALHDCRLPYLRPSVATDQVTFAREAGEHPPDAACELGDRLTGRCISRRCPAGVGTWRALGYKQVPEASWVRVYRSAASVVPELILPAWIRPGMVLRGTHSMRLDSKSSSGGPIRVAVRARYRWCTEVEMPGVGSTRSSGVRGPGRQPVSSSVSLAAAAAGASPCSARASGVSQP